ncbi:MAG TPA: isoprenylcysteine carboxylmethyltransferase family protein [Solirubrobacteraceae bacterium]|nr:isoprenylcysteine carboxylmethyltransferase family protein [Solirubrobacteraceae bacterium]HME03171.1 isoprenylcysteine carboxylmethyltransferase family protein [Solirubrobacteraceae bacterium]
MSGSERTRENPGVIAPPPLIYLAGLALGFALEALLPSRRLRGVRVHVAGLLLALGGLSLAREFFLTFRRAGTPVDPRRAATILVTHGPYRFTRNPAYLGMALLYSGITLLRGALWPFATLAAVLALVDRGVIAREERYLSERFGQPYTDYSANVRRWI